jgi:hypothetical protein
VSEKERSKLLEQAAESDALDGLRILARERFKSRELRKLLKASESRCEELDQALAAFEVLKQTNAKPIKIKRGKKRDKPPATVVALLSDTHSCEFITHKETGGRNQHDVGIGEERIHSWLGQLVKILEVKSQTHNVSLVLGLIGDYLVNAEMHGADSVRAVDRAMTPLQEVAHLKEKILGPVIETLLKTDIEQIAAVCVPGNHGRVGQKERYSAEGYWNSSFEGYLLRDLAASYADTRIAWDVTPQAFKSVEIAGPAPALVFGHGQTVRSNGGVSGLAAPLRSAHIRWAKTWGSPMLINIGHHHTLSFFWGSGAVNGALCGYSSYAAGRALGFEPPSQMVYTVDGSTGDIESITPVYV